MNKSLSGIDRELINLLAENARLSITSLAQKLGVSRVTVQNHLQSLERGGVIKGYTLRLSPDFERNLVTAHVLISTNQKHLGALTRQIESSSSVKALYSISGEFDLVAVVMCESTQELDQQIDFITSFASIQKTQTSIILSEKFSR